MKTKLTKGKILWYDNRGDYGVLLDERKNKYYVDSSCLVDSLSEELIGSVVQFHAFQDATHTFHALNVRLLNPLLRKKKTSLFSKGLPLFFFAFFLFFSLKTSKAEMAPSYLSEEAKGGYQQCDGFCQSLKFDLLGNEGSWGSKSDLYCADLGEATNNFGIKYTSIHADFQSCSVPISESLGNEINNLIQNNRGNPLLEGFTSDDFENNKEVVGCQIAQKMKRRCHFKNSIVEKECTAYNALADKKTGAVAANSSLVALNGLAASLCTTACATTASGVGAVVSATSLSRACNAAALALGITEMGYSIAQTQSETGQRIQNYMTAASGGALAMGQIATSVTHQAQRAKAMDAAYKNNPQDYEGVSEARKGNKQGKASKAMECANAAVLTAMTAIRVSNLITYDDIMKNQCEKINDLLTPNRPVTSNNNKGPSSSGNQSGKNSNGNGNAYGGKTGAPSLEQLEQYDRCRSNGNSVVECAKASGISSPSVAAATGDFISQIPQGGELDQILSSNPLKLSDFVKQAKSQGVSAALGNHGQSPILSELSSLSEIAKKEASEGKFKGLFPEQSLAGSYTSSGKSFPTPQNDLAPFDQLLTPKENEPFLRNFTPLETSFKGETKKKNYLRGMWDKETSYQALLNEMRAITESVLVKKEDPKVSVIQRKKFKNEFLKLELPEPWTCGLTQKAWLCQPQDHPTHAMMTLSSTYTQQQETLDSLREVLMKERKYYNSTGVTGTSKVVSETIMGIKGARWAQVIQINSDFMNSQSHYLGIISQGRSILVTITLKGKEGLAYYESAKKIIASLLLEETQKTLDNEYTKEEVNLLFRKKEGIADHQSSEFEKALRAPASQLENKSPFSSNKLLILIAIVGVAIVGLYKK